MRSLRVAYGETLLKLGKEQQDILVFDADLSGSTQTAIFQKQFPDRHFNMGIAENNMVLFASGASRMNHTVFASSFAMFLAGRSWEMVRNSVAHDRLNVKLVATHAGITVGEDGSSHQMIEDLSIMKSIPQLQVFSPADYTETQKIIEYSVTTKEPMYIRLSRDVSIDVFDETYQFIPFIPIFISQQEGSKGLIITTGLLTGLAKQAIQEINHARIKVDHLHIPTIKPLDLSSILENIKQYKYMASFEEHNIIGGLGDTLLGELAIHQHPPLHKFGLNDQFGRSGSVKDLWAYFGLDIFGIAKNITQLDSQY